MNGDRVGVPRPRCRWFGSSAWCLVVFDRHARGALRRLGIRKRDLRVAVPRHGTMHVSRVASRRVRPHRVQVLWKKGIDILLALMKTSRESGRMAFPIDVYGSGADLEQVWIIPPRARVSQHAGKKVGSIVQYS